MNKVYAFGEFVLDPQRHTLRCGEDDLGLGERSFGVLKILVENAGRVVSRQELLDGVWPDVAVTDDSLARAVSDLRTALGDHSNDPRFIRTAHRQGYLFIESITAIDESESPSRQAVILNRNRSRIAIGLAAVTALALVVVVAVRWFGQGVSHPDDAPLTEIAAWRLRALGPSPFTATAIKPSFAKTSNLLAVVAPDPETGSHSIFLLRPDGGEPLQLTHDIEVRGPTPEFTADDSHILFTTFRSDPNLGLVPDIWRVPLPSGNPTLVVENASSASTSPDGRQLVYAAVTPGGTAIRIRNLDGSEVEIAAHGFWPRWSPDGRWIAFTTSDPEGGEGTIHVVRADGPEHRELTSTPSQHYGLCWTPDSSRVIFASKLNGPTTLWAVDINHGTLSSVTRGPGICTSPTMSADGRRLVFSFALRRWHLYTAAEAGEPANHVLAAPGVQAAALSPEGSRVALAQGSEAQSPVVSILDLTTRDRRTVSGMAASGISWMPDGESLLMAAPAPDGSVDWIWRLPLGGGLPEPILAGGSHWRAPIPSPDGSTVAATRRSATGWELVVLDLERREDRVVAQKPWIEAPRWSPDGRRLAWSGSQRPEDVDSGGIWVCEVQDGTPRRLALDGAWPVWEEDGEHLVFGRFLHQRGIWRVSLTGGSPAIVRALDSEMEDLYLEGLDVGQDGSPVLFILAQYTGELYSMEAPTDF